MNNTRVSIVMFLSILAISTAAILVRLVPDMHPISIALWRTGIAAIVLAPVWTKKDAVRPTGTRLAWSIVAGLCLALHFWTWFASLQLTTVMRSTVLVCLTPVWAGVLAWGIFKEPPTIRFWTGIAVALLGVGVMAMGGDASDDQANWQGDALAVLGGMLSGAYLTIGRSVRPHVDWGPYGALLCTSCALWLCLFGWMAEAPFELVGQHAIWVVLAMAIGPQLLGHIGFNWAVRYVPATIIGAIILLEPVGATALGTLVLDEWPSLTEMVGAAIIVVGVMAATIQAKTADQSG